MTTSVTRHAAPQARDERDDGRVDEPAEFRGRHVDYFAVRAGVERDLRLAGEALSR